MNATARVAAGLGFEGIELVINWGLGVDSTAYLVKMLEDPAAHGVDLARTLVMHQLTGDEWPATRAHADIGKSGYQNLRNARSERASANVRCSDSWKLGRLLSGTAIACRTENGRPTSYKTEKESRQIPWPTPLPFLDC